MEPNAIPGLANRRVAGRVYRALVGFEATRAWFPTGKCEVTGLPVRPEFFDIAAEARRNVYGADHRRKPRRAHAEPGVA